MYQLYPAPRNSIGVYIVPLFLLILGIIFIVSMSNGGGVQVFDNHIIAATATAVAP